MLEKRKSYTQSFARIGASALSLLLVISMWPMAGLAEDVHAGNAEPAIATQGEEMLGEPTQDNAPIIPDDSIEIDSQTVLDGQNAEEKKERESESVAPATSFKTAEVKEEETGSEDGKGHSDEGEPAEMNGRESALEKGASLGATELSTQNVDAETGPNPFKTDVDAQPLINYENYDKYSEEVYPGQTAAMWKTSVGCAGTKMWAGTLIQDNGYWDQPGWSFDCGWSAPDPLHAAEVYGRVKADYANTVDGTTKDVVLAEGDAGLTSLDLGAVFDGSYDVYTEYGAFQYNRLRSLSIPSFVKSLSEASFKQDGTNAFLTSLSFETDAQGGGIEEIRGAAFESCSGLAQQELIAFPSSLKYLEGAAFQYCGALKVRIDNPDIRFSDKYNDEDDIGCPFDEGTTIYAYKKKSDGTESDPYRLSQREGGKIYRYVWLDDEANLVTVKGQLELPADVNAQDAAITLEQNGKIAPIALSEDGTFAYKTARPAVESIASIQLPGYYEMSFVRAASQMEGTWDLGMLSADSFRKIPAKRAFAVSVMQKTGQTDEGGNDALVAVTDWSKLTFALKRNGIDLACGEDGDYEIQNDMVVLSEALANEEGILDQLSLEITPDDSLKLSRASAEYDAVLGSFRVVLPSWGSAAIFTNASFAGRSHVMVFDGIEGASPCILDDYSSVSWSDGQTDPNWLIRTGQLKAGAYTVVAFKPVDMAFNASHLRSIDRLGIPTARATIVVCDGETANITLDVPDFDRQEALANMGVKSVNVKAPASPVVVGCEAIIEVGFEMEGDQAARIALDIPSADYETSSAAFEKAGSVYVDSQVERMYIDIPQGSKSDTLYIALRPTKEQYYSIPVSLAVGGSTAPAGSASFLALGTYVQVPGNCVSKTGNKAIAYAAPDSQVKLSIDGQNVGEGTTNSLGRASILFDVPEDIASGLLYGDGVKLEVAKGDSTNYTNCTYRPAAEIWSFKITNQGHTQERIVDGKESDGYLTLHHQIPLKENAYWTFDVTVKTNGQEINASRTMMMYAELSNGDTVCVPFNLKSRAGNEVRYVGEYVDEAYLELLDAYPNSTFSTALLYQEGLFIPESYHFSNFALSYKANLDDEDYRKRIHERAEQEAKDHQAYLATFWEEYLKNGGNDEAEAIAKETDAMLGSIVSALKSREDADSDEVRAAIAEIEALRPDFQDITTRLLEPTEDDWIPSIDKPFYTGEFANVETPQMPSDTDIEAWAAALGTTNEQLKADLAQLNKAMDQDAANVRETQRRISEAIDEMGEELGVGKPSEAGSPYQLMDNSLEEQGNGSLTVTDGNAAKGDLISTSTEGRFTGEVFVTESQKNGQGGKTPGIYSGFSTHVTEAAPAGTKDTVSEMALAEKKDANSHETSYTVDFDDNHEHHDGAIIDTKWGYGLDILGIGLDGVTKPVGDWASTKLFSKVLPNELFKSRHIIDWNPIIKEINAYSNLSIARIEAETVASAASISKQIQGGISTLGLLGNMVGMNRTTDSWCSSMNELGNIESDIEQINAWILYYKQVNPCDSDCTRCLEALYAERDAAEKYRDYVREEDNHNWFDIKANLSSTFASAITTVCSLGSGSIAQNAVTVGEAASKGSVAIDVASMEVHLLRAPWIDVAKNEYEEARIYRESVCKDTKKKVQDEKAEKEALRRTIDWDRFYGSKIVLDPSGIVYEGVVSNAVEDATATIYRADDAQGTGAVPWNAAAYEQVSPQTTGADGAFQWDVPTGYYQVRVTKDGYEEARTEWLTVLPIQSGLEIPLVSTAAPEVRAARAYPDRVELEFSQYMKTQPKLNIGGLGEAVREVLWEEAETSPDGTELAKKLTIYLNEPLMEGAKVSLSLQGAESYNGKTLGGQSGWTQELTVEKRPAKLFANYENAVSLQSGATADIVVYVRYADGSPVANQGITAVIGSDSIAAFTGARAGTLTTTLVTDSKGEATLSLAGDLPGLTKLALSADGTALAKTLDIRTTSDAGQPVRPIATIASLEFGSSAPKENSAEVAKGSMLTLTTPTEGASIYYTTDDTCPCDPSGTRKLYTGPIPVNSSAKYRITAFKDGMPFDNYSERLNLSLTVLPDSPDPGTTPGGNTDDNPGGIEGEGTGTGSSGSGVLDTPGELWNEGGVQDSDDAIQPSDGSGSAVAATYEIENLGKTGDGAWKAVIPLALLSAFTAILFVFLKRGRRS